MQSTTEHGVTQSASTGLVVDQAACQIPWTGNRKLAFFVPHLRTGMRLLEGGCSSGSMALELAGIVDPGEVVGIDLDAERLEYARAAATHQNLSNVRFERANVLSLPFENDSFDAAFLSSVCEHLENPLAALRELCRVVKPGGVVGVRDHEPSGMLVTPHDPLFDEMLALVLRYRTHEGSDFQIARKLRGMLRGAGLQRVTGTGTAEVHGSTDGTRRFGEAMLERLSTAPWVSGSMALGWIDQARFGQIKEAWRAWSHHPDAFVLLPECEAVGWVE
jgi:ubiquinone/menaquinone biosynthesis C-methylase UbiE